MSMTIDGTTYNVRVGYPTISRAFEVIEGKNAGTSLDYTRIRDLIGTRYSYTLMIEPDPAHRTDYDSLYSVISAPQDYLLVSFPYGQTTLSFEAYIVSGTDTFGGKLAGQNRWNGLSVTFVPLRPQV